MNPFNLEVPEITKPNRPRKTLSDAFILSQLVWRKQKSIWFYIEWAAKGEKELCHLENIIVPTFLAGCVNKFNIWNISFFFFFLNGDWHSYFYWKVWQKKKTCWFCPFFSPLWFSHFFNGVHCLVSLLIRSYFAVLQLFCLFSPQDLLYHDI